MTYRIRELAKKFGLSRTTLLYYDAIGLLKPSIRNKAGYRLYTREDCERLQKINLFKESGIPLHEIPEYIAATEPAAASALLARLSELNRKIGALKAQQELILTVFRNSELHKYRDTIDMDTWLRIFGAAGIDEESADNWRPLFEARWPDIHGDFLSILGFSEEELQSLRRRLREASGDR